MHTGICCTSWRILPTFPYPSGNHGTVIGSKSMANYGKVIHHNGVYIRTPISCELM